MSVKEKKDISYLKALIMRYVIRHEKAYNKDYGWYNPNKPRLCIEFRGLDMKSIMDFDVVVFNILEKETATAPKRKETLFIRDIDNFSDFTGFLHAIERDVL